MAKMKILLVLLLAFVFYGVNYCILSPGVCRYYADYYLFSERSFSLAEERAFRKKKAPVPVVYFMTYNFSGNSEYFDFLGTTDYGAGGIWSVGNTAELRLTMPEITAGVILDFEVNPYLNKKNDRVLVQVFRGEKKLAEWDFLYGRKKPSTTVKIARKYLRSNGVVTLTFKIEGAASPQSLGYGADNRKLGLNFESLKLIPADK